jgi:hypothetical protein
MRLPVLFTAAAALLFGLAPFQAARAQLTYQWQGVGAGDWENASNWVGGLVPDAGFNEVGEISNGGTAFVDSVIASGPGGLLLAAGGGTTGGLEIRTGGTLNIVQGAGGNTSLALGALAVGQNQGSGTVQVQTGGTLTAHTISVNNVPFNPIVNLPDSSITVSGTGTLRATFDSDSPPEGGDVTINGVLRVNGPLATVSAANNFNINANGVYVAGITGASHSVISVGGTANLSGALQANFSGVTPALGSTWTLFDADAVTGTFSSVEVTGATTGPGRRYAVNTVAGGANGQLAQLSLTRVLALQVNRDTGEVRILTPFGPAENISGYSISSASSAFNAASWNSLQDQAVSGWTQGAGGPLSLNELRNNSGGGFTAIGGAFQPSLGNVFAPAAPAQFGDPVVNDLQFEYAIAGNRVIDGDVFYIGSNHNNLVLTVDPTSGKAQLKNGSSFNVSITNYTIQSENGSLTTAGWQSLSDLGVAGWGEANPTTTALSEVRTSCMQSLTPSQSFNIGSPFVVGAKQDLTLEYLLAGESITRQGVVTYGTISIPGDFNNNGVVNSADLTVWRGAFGTGPGADADSDGDSDGNDFLIWQRNLGVGSPATAVAGVVPEPASLALAANLLLAIMVSRPRIPRRQGSR